MDQAVMLTPAGKPLAEARGGTDIRVRKWRYRLLYFKDLGYLLCLIVIHGAMLTYGILVPSMKSKFFGGTIEDNLSLNSTDLHVPALQLCFYYWTLPLGIVLVELFGSILPIEIGALICTFSALGASVIDDRLVFSTIYGVFYGIGAGMVNATCVVGLRKHFRYLTGLSMMGDGLGLVLFSSLAFVRDFEFETLLRIVGLASASIVIFGLVSIADDEFFIPMVQRDENFPSCASCRTDFLALYKSFFSTKVFSFKGFTLISIIMFLASFGSYYSIYAIPATFEKPNQAFWSLSLIGIGTITGLTLETTIYCPLSIRENFAISLLLILEGVAIISVDDTVYRFKLFHCFCIGFCFVVFRPLSSAVCIEFLGRYNLRGCIGWLSIIRGLSILAGLAVFPIFQSIWLPGIFVIVAGLLALGFIFLVAFPEAMDE